MCPVSGFPKPQVQWLFNGAEISDSDLNHYVDDQGALVIPFATNDIAGLYVCRATNAAGRDKLDIAVQVLGQSVDSVHCCDSSSLPVKSFCEFYFSSPH